MNNIKYKDEKDAFCQNCLAGKQHRLPFPVSETRAKATGELIHADLCGTFEVQSLGGANDFLLLIDDFSGFRVAYFIKNKSETEGKIENFITMAENQTGHKIITLRSYNGLEFINKELSEVLNKKEIRHERSCSYTPEQNDRAEREMRTIVEARCFTVIN